MNRAEHLKKHEIALPAGYVPNPKAHLANPRDAYHFQWARNELRDLPGCSILDVGCWDGWLDFLLIGAGHFVHGVELMSDLADAARAYANQHRIPSYHAYTGFWDGIELTRTYDVVACFETLEHVDLDLVPAWVAKMEATATKRILISLPDQDHRENAQHSWTPSLALCHDLFAGKRNLRIDYKDYPGTEIPANFFIRWDK